MDLLLDTFGLDAGCRSSRRLIHYSSKCGRQTVQTRARLFGLSPLLFGVVLAAAAAVISGREIVDALGFLWKDTRAGFPPRAVASSARFTNSSGCGAGRPRRMLVAVAAGAFSSLPRTAGVSPCSGASHASATGGKGTLAATGNLHQLFILLLDDKTSDGRCLGIHLAL